MTIAGYPITEVKRIPKLLTDAGYQIWYWSLPGNALNCPIEPLTPNFWREKRKAFLVHGLVIPETDESDRGDLLILVTVKLKHLDPKYEYISHQEWSALYDFLERRFLRITGLRRNRHFFQDDFLGMSDEAFQLQILPKPDEKGEYRRDLRFSYEGYTLPSDPQGRFNCPRCNRLIGIDRGLWILDTDYDRHGTIRLFSVCDHCNELIRVNVDSPGDRSFLKRSGTSSAQPHGTVEQAVFRPTHQAYPRSRSLKIEFAASMAIKRVPIGFPWPLHKPWWGHTLESMECQTCGGNGKSVVHLTQGSLGKDDRWCIHQSDACPTCGGGKKVQPRVEIPEGPGYQLWDTTEGSPISPALATPEELALWLADNEIYIASYRTWSYTKWLKFITDTGGTPIHAFDETDPDPNIELAIANSS